MTHLLDTNVCIDVIRRRSTLLLERITSFPIDGLAVSTITVAELNYGARKSSFPDRNRIALLEFLVPFRILDFDQAAARVYGSVRRQLERDGMQIGPLDTLIASHALSAGLIVVSKNEREFRRVPGLTVQNWVL